MTIEIDGPVSKIANRVSGGLPLVGQAFTLVAGSNETKKFDFFPKTYAEMFGTGGFKKLFRDKLYGAVITITEIRQQADGTRTRDIHTFRGYRWVNVIYAPEAKSSSGNSAAFHRTLTNSVFEDTFVRTKKVDYRLPTPSKPASADLLLGPPSTWEGSFPGAGPSHGNSIRRRAVTGRPPLR